MKSTEFLQAAIDVQAERGKQYDKPTGERSMAATVNAFNCITGRMLEESDGWMFLGLLKLVRQSQNPEQYHHDSALDFVAYASLYAEAASEQCGQLEAQQAEKAAHIISDMPSWERDIPEWANWLGQGLDGSWEAYEDKPTMNHDHWSHEMRGINLWKFEGKRNEDWRNTLQPRPTSTAK